MKSKFIGIALLLGVACIAIARQPGNKPAAAAPHMTPWAQEPDSFLGIKFGSDASSIPACGPSTNTPPAEICFHQFATGEAGSLRGLPDLGMHAGDGVSATISLLDGKVAMFTVTVDHADYEKMRSMLLTRYGQPIKTGTGTVETIGGGQFNSEEMLWKGPHINLSSEERASQVDRSQFIVADRRLVDELARRFEDKNKDAAAKL
jgi:hypothetical protein